MKVRDKMEICRDRLVAITSRVGVGASVLFMSIGIVFLMPIAAQAQKTATVSEATLMEKGKTTPTLSPIQQDCAQLAAAYKTCLTDNCAQLEATATAARVAFRTCINNFRGNTTGPGEYSKQERDACQAEYDAWSAASTPYVQCANGCHEKTYGSYDSLLWAEEVHLACLNLI